MNTLAQYLLSQKLSQQGFAQLVGTTQANISMLTRGLRIPRPPLAQAIEAATKGGVPAKVWWEEALTPPVQHSNNETKT